MELPSYTVAKELLVTFFCNGHHLLSLLYGPTCFCDALYAEEPDGRPWKPGSLGISIIIQCLFNIARLELPHPPPQGQMLIRSEEQLLLALTFLSLKYNLESI